MVEVAKCLCTREEEKVCAYIRENDVYVLCYIYRSKSVN